MALNPLNRKLDKNGNPIVSKAELDKSGMSLRDFLNAERGLKRRGGAEAEAKAPVSEERSSTADGPATATAKEVAALRSSAGKASSDSSREVTARELAESTTPASDRKVPSRIRAASTSDTSDFVPGGMKKGGKVSSASSRADGIASKGKTKGRFV
jgi:hypothetical protein